VADDAPFAVQVDAVEATLYLGGDFDAGATERFDLAFAELLATGNDDVVIDLRDLEHLGSTGLGRLLRARDRRPRLMLRNLSPAHRRMLEAAGAAGLFTIEDPPD
jgi:anti-anti-sigma factor